MGPVDPAGLFSLRGRVALVTGAGGHLGRAIAAALAGAGAQVVLAGRRPEPLEAVRDALRADGGSVEIRPFDVADPRALAEAVAALGASEGRLDVLVNNAYSGRTGTLEQAEPEDFGQAFAVAVGAASSLVRAALPLFDRAVAATGQASVINIASMYALVSPDPSIYGDTGHNSPPWYGAAKAGLIQLTRYHAVHLAPRGIRVNAIAPGPFPKPRVAETMPVLWQALNRKVPLGRVGRPEEICGAVQFLASDASSFVTGVTLPVDGGWTAW